MWQLSVHNIETETSGAVQTSPKEGRVNMFRVFYILFERLQYNYFLERLNLLV